MPMYDYVCESCEREFELLTSRRGEEADLAPCPGCGEQARRQLSVPMGIIVSGSTTPVRRHTRRIPKGGGASRQGGPKVDSSQLDYVDKKGNLREAGTGKVLKEAGSKG